MRKGARLVALSAVLALASVAACARMTPQQRDEWRFLKEASAALRFETEAARLALGKSGDPYVRNYASAMIENNLYAGNELQHLLQMRGMAQPMLANDQRKTLNRLTKIQGKKFDREFVFAVAFRQRQQGAGSFERASLSIQDPQVKAWIERTLPTRQTSAPARLYKTAGPLIVRTALTTRPATAISESGSR